MTGRMVAGGNKSLRRRFFRAMAANDQTKTLVMVILINIFLLERLAPERPFRCGRPLARIKSVARD